MKDTNGFSKAITVARPTVTNHFMAKLSINVNPKEAGGVCVINPHPTEKYLGQARIRFTKRLPECMFDFYLGRLSTTEREKAGTPFRSWEGKPCEVIFKRDTCGDYWINIVCEIGTAPPVDYTPHIPTVIGVDFGIRKFMTCTDGADFWTYEAMLPYEKNLKQIRFLGKSVSRKRTSEQKQRKRCKDQDIPFARSKSLQRKRDELAKLHRTNRRIRRDSLWKIAHDLADRGDIFCFETLDLRAMAKGLKGRKLLDSGWGIFLKLFEQVCKKKGKIMYKASQWKPTSKQCSTCLEENGKT